MKYFIRTLGSDSAAELGLIDRRPHQITKKFAFGLYREAVIREGLDVDENMVQQMTKAYMKMGKRVDVNKGGFRLWGDDVSDKELFKLRLKGDIGRDIL